MSNVRNNIEVEEELVVKNDLNYSSSLCNSSMTSSEEELPIPRLQNSSSMLMRNLITTTPKLSTSSETANVTLPYPLKLDEEYIYRIGLKPEEFINYCQAEAMKFMFNDPMDFIDSFIKDRLRKGLDIGINQECLDHLNNIRQIYHNDESLEHDVYDYIEVQIMKLIDSPDFESPPNGKWSQIPCPSFNSSTSKVISYDLNIYPNRNNFKQSMHDNLNVFDLLGKTQTENDQNIRLYHGTDIKSIKNLCQYGINLYASHRLGSDFGPGFYVTENFDDALYRAVSKARRSKTFGGVVCFQLRDTEFHQFNIQELNETTEESTDSLEWSNFVKLCRRRFAEYPHIFRRDAFRGSICNNAEKVYRTEYERPQAKIVGNRKPIQICIKSTTMASKLEGSILGVYVIDISSQ